MTQNLRELSAAPLLDGHKPPRFSGASWGYIAAFFGTVLFSMKAILVKLAYLPGEGLAANELDAITIMALRLGFASPFYLAIFYVSMRKLKQNHGMVPARRDMVLAAFVGVLGYYICAWLDIEGIKYITAQLERLLLFTYPIFVFVFGAMFFGKPLTRGAIIAILMAYGGIALIFLGGDIAIGANVPLGTAMILTCAAAFAFFQLFSKPMISRLGAAIFTCCAMLGAGSAIFIHFIIENAAAGSFGDILNLPPRIWALGLALAIFSTLLPSFMVSFAVGRVGPQATSAIGMTSPVITILLAIWWLSEPFGLMDAAGTAITIAGIGLYTWLDKRAQVGR